MSDTVERLTDLLYNEQEKEMFSEEAAKAVAKKLYNQIGEERAKRYIEACNANPEAMDRLKDGYIEENTDMLSILGLITNPKAIKEFAYKLTARLEELLHKNNYDFKKAGEELYDF